MLTQICKLRRACASVENHDQDRSEDAPDLRAASSVCTLSQIFTDFLFSAPARRYLSDKLFLECPTSARRAEWGLSFGSSRLVRSRKHSEMDLILSYLVFLTVVANLVAPEFLLERSARSGIPPY